MAIHSARLLYQSHGKQKHPERHLLAAAPAAIKEATHAVENYLAIGRVDQPPRPMPVKSTETAPQLPAWEAGLFAMMGAMAKPKILPYHSLLTPMEAKPAKQQQGCFKVRRTSLAERLLKRRQATVPFQANPDEKDRRSGTGLTSPVTGSQNSERANQQDATSHDGQNGWTVVKRKHVQDMRLLLENY